MRPGLQLFLHHCLGNNPYLESPFLRGLFFSSGRQEGGAASSVLKEFVPPVAAHADSHTGLFLHDFFGRILPQDRHIGRPAALINRWRATTHNLGLAAWVLLCVALGILITVGFLKNVETVNLVRETYPLHAQFVGKLEQDAETLDKINQTLITVDRRNRDWSASWMVASTNIDDLEHKLKQDYVANFRKYILAHTDELFESELESLLKHDPDHELPAQIRNQVRYINLLQARLTGASREVLQAMPQMASPNPQRQPPQLYVRINELRLSHLAWTAVPDDGFLPARLPQQQQQLDRLAFNDPPLAWLGGLVALDSQMKPVTVGDFWGGFGHRRQSAAAADTTTAYSVPAAFTLAGRAEIDRFLSEMEKSVDDGPRFAARRAAFETWYRQQRLQAWQAFATAFPSGERGLAGEVEWRTAIGTITGAQSPYYRLIDRLTEEFKNEPEAPGWLLLARNFPGCARKPERPGPPKARSSMSAPSTTWAARPCVKRWAARCSLAAIPSRTI